MRIAVASGKGGTGKTTVAVNLAVTAARAGHEVHLCDCDVEEPNAHLYLNPRIDLDYPVTTAIPVVVAETCDHCGLCANICRFNAIACLPDQTVVFPDLCHSCGGCWLLCPQQAMTPGQRILGRIAEGATEAMGFTQGTLRVGETVVPPVIKAVKATIRREDWAILDAPPGTSCPVVETLRDVDFVLLVTEPTPFGLHDLALSVKLARWMKLPFGVVVNKDNRDTAMIEDYCREAEVEILARIPFKRESARVGATGQLIIDTDPAAAEVIGSLYQTLSERQVRI